MARFRRSSTPLAAEPPTPAAKPSGGGTAGKVVLIVVGVIAGIIAFGLLAGGCALVAVDQTQRDDDGFLMSPSKELATPTYAIVSESADLDTEGAEWALDTFLGTVRIRSDSDASRVRRHRAGRRRRPLPARASSTTWSTTSTTGRPRVHAADRAALRRLHRATQTFWTASASGSGEQTLDWEPEDGNWRVVVMNDDASRGVSSDMSIGAELDSVLWIGLGLLGLGVLFAAATALAITGAVRRR